ncbi:FAD-dependent oxidoreductase [Flavobacterium gawalongense]|uniref:NAD(P)/FAD-dependent oxidoreductase n=1 Tax=Flavobacterium gawalongense TaxID=2594432 RepID=A0A553BLY7_9FLAO|nr:FAD-dependent oxidoreductase [Flavobacterium gawalongense]TRX01266.1 NAD(P)/FAD-dependent oxidoreductase [Flavobacterium gawalongense]TRX05291.1 NAD(P)/FAD-dependent oxidoreductase [Flavobacterium gawalongense]TRX09183.1 NAD(P)/FAD-dependent oxidoreductase [Flavobacterium gawalongense]TRX09255.1 NAD(P)/FAD-dependent oxidoreductase [Flavobacterium gawalongense]TRX26702.1 NAD(P)/FAD-dependent oxidoreductase [Flavobacterium gawalongense]
MFDTLIFGGGVSGMSCALVLGSAKNKSFATDKKIGIFTHQKTSALQEALFNNAYGIAAGKLGSELLTESVQHLSQTYPHITQIPDEKVLKIKGEFPEFMVTTNRKTYKTKIIVIGIGSANTFTIDGLMQYVEPHQKSLPEKQRIQLKNSDHKVADGIYVIGTLAGWRSQLAIAAGSGAAVATDILTLWNGGVQTHCHDSIR